MPRTGLFVKKKGLLSKGCWRRVSEGWRLCLVSPSAASSPGKAAGGAMACGEIFCMTAAPVVAHPVSPGREPTHHGKALISS